VSNDAIGVTSINTRNFVYIIYGRGHI
jgi:hypothetical protein